ncbi:MAG: type II secretion system protein [Deltaproteobacteria bacterium]|nr:type II secretion system protein [Deltaproteobacteria bacterium]
MRRSHSGFVLIEILVAISVLAISLVVILQLFSGGLKTRKLSEEYARGVFHAREKMAEIQMVPDLSEGDLQGEFEDAYQWRAVITRVVPEEAEENLPVDLLNIQVNITWREGAKEKSFVVSTLRAAKKETDGS